LTQIAARPIELFPNQAVQEAILQDGEDRSKNPTYQALIKDEMAVADLGVPLPASFEDYLALGRCGQNPLAHPVFSLRFRAGWPRAQLPPAPT
jgi:hypothetical protein